MALTRASHNQICIGRVLYEDDAFMTLEIVKDENRQLRLEQNDKFFSVLFVHQVDGKMEVWVPWKETE